MGRYGLLCILLFAAGASSAQAQVTRWGDGCRYPQNGWTVLHLQGQPYQRGEQHGRLMAPEIAAYLRCFALTLSDKAPQENWRHTRTLVNALFLRKFDKEYLEEMKGIADGATAAGARFDGKAIDVIDIAALNCWCEIESLPSALAATPTGLEQLAAKKDALPARPMPGFERCSAFAATGPATADGKIVFGHVTMYDLYAANFANVWIDIKPAKGHRFVMSSFPGGIQSSMDYYINDAGILLSETTVTQTRFNIDGQTCASRVRKAIQYADSIDKVIEHMTRDNNGLYTNEWLLADINTNEIALLELGTRKHKLWRSSKNEWIGNAPGFYWSCNSMKDMDVRLETIPSAKARPSKVVWRPGERDIAWHKLYEKHKGKIGSDFAHEFSASKVLAGSTALDSKFTTTALAKNLKSWAVFGPPTGVTRKPTKEERKKYPEIKPLVKHEWTLLGATPPARTAGDRQAPVLPNAPAVAENDVHWRGTLLPARDADIWLALAFADYHDIVTAKDSAKALEACRKQYTEAAKSDDVTLADIKRSPASDAWHRLASAKGTLLLHQLRSDLGADLFDKAMDDFGVKHGGERVTSQQFQRHLEAASRRSLEPFFRFWLRETGLPKSDSGR